MPTLLRELLNNYSEQDLEKLARDKIDDFDHLRLPKSVLIEELSNLLTSPSYIYDKVAFRSPPSFEILDILLNSPGYESPLSGFRKKVLEKTKRVIGISKEGEFLSKGQDYSLYLKILQSAWESNQTIERSEAKLLETLREELEITFKEHCILEHHPKVNKYWDDGNPFQRERNHLLHSGIIYVSDENDSYVLPEEIAYQVLSLWEVELDDYDYSRLLNNLQKDSLSEILTHFNLKVSGTKDELVNRIVENYIPARKTLEILHKDELSDLCKKIDCKSSGLKEEVVDRLINNFRDDYDLIETESEEVEEVIEEEKILAEDQFRRLFNAFTTSELQYLLSQVPTLVTYGRKDEKVNRLWAGPYSESTLLDLLTKRELQEACREFDLLISGRKEDLVERILKYFTSVVDGDLGTDEDSDIDTQSEKVPKTDEESKDYKKDEIPNLDEVQNEFHFLNTDQQVILASLFEFKSLNEQDIDRIVARYDLGWLFYKPEMSRLIDLLTQNGYDLVEQHSFGESDRYDLRYERDN